MGDRVHSAGRVCAIPSQPPSPSSLEGEKEEVYPKAACREKPARVAGCSVPPLCMENRERKEGIGHGRGERAPCRGTGENKRDWKERARNQNKQILGGRGRGQSRSYQDFSWGLELSHTPVMNPCPPWAVMCEPYFGKLRQGQPQLLGEAVPAPGESPRAVSCPCRGLTETPLSRPGVGATGQNPSHVLWDCVRQKAASTPLIPVTPNPA